MANVITVTKLLDGPRNGAYHLSIVSDGVSADFDGETIIDPADLIPELGNEPSLTITGIKADLSGFAAMLSFGYLATNTPIWTISADQTIDVCFDDVGGIKDRSGIDGNGKLLLTTFGISGGFSGHIIIKFRKD